MAMLCAPQEAWAASELSGSEMGWMWSFPFLGILLSIATGPTLYPKIWHRHYGKIAFGWAAVTVALLAVFHGVAATLGAVVHAMLTEYVSFILLLFALYTVAGGILVTGNMRANPWTNAATLALGASIASIIGTTGAAMVLIRPVIRANKFRKHRPHVIVFFIILVANIGGALSPLGDPPLFIGYLHGVDFFWTTNNLWPQTLLVAGLVLAIFLAVDFWLFRKEVDGRDDTSDPIGVRGSVNFILIGIIIAAMLISAGWRPGIEFDFYGSKFALQNVLRDLTFVAAALASLWLTPEEHRAANGFGWEPIREVAILFAGIFVAIIPVMAMLKAGSEGAFGFLLHAVTTPSGEPHQAAYFWLTGGLSAFLDNAPTYLVFFELAGGDARHLMGVGAGTLASISMGAVYMGALTYIGNAPNFMVRAIAEENGIRMPNFFSYMLWAGLILLPLLALLTLLPLAPLLQL
jgi:Na+/H+ antiporter NhaD/arsenite permease-like protein